jgi:hypothetical protein
MEQAYIEARGRPERRNKCHGERMEEKEEYQKVNRK